MSPMLKALLWLDIKVFWVVTFGRAKPGETISAASWSLYLDGKWQGEVAVPIIDFLARCVGDDADHYRRAYVWQFHLYTKGFQ